MRRLSRIACAALWLVGGAARAEGTPFEVPAQQVVARVKTVVIAPPLLRAPGELPADLVPRLEARAAAALAAAGLAVVPSAVYAETWRPLSEAVGGTYDAGSGELLDSANSVREHTLRELQRLHQVDAALDIAIFGGRIPFQVGGQWTTWSGYWDLAGQRMQIGGKDVPTSNEMLAVDGVWVIVHLSDVTGVTLYRNGGPVDWLAFRTPSRIEERPAGELLGADRYEVFAMLLDPLRQAYKPDPPKKRR